MEWLATFIDEANVVLASAGLSVAAIVTYFIAFLRLAKRAIDNGTFQKELDHAKAEVEVKLKKEYDEKLAVMQKEFIDSLSSLEKKVIGKIDDNEAERAKMIKAQTIDLETTINAVNKAASIDDILR